MSMNKISIILRFMHTQDYQGKYLEQLKQITEGKQTFSSESIINTLQEWYIDSNDKMYLDWIEYVKTLK